MPRSEVVTGHVLAFLRRYPGVAVITSGIGARDPVMWDPSERREVPAQPRRTSRTHDCVKAAIMNAVFEMQGEAAADGVQKFVDADPRLYTTFRPLGEVMRAAGEPRVRCCASRDDEVQCAIQSADRMDAFRLLASKRSGVFVVHLRAVKRVDLVVVVDAINGAVFDSEEPSALVLSLKVLERCGGDG